MTQAPLTAGEHQFDFPFTTEDFNHLRDVITKHTGIMLPDGKKTMLYSRLVRRLRALQFQDFKSYISYLEEDMKNQQHELSNIIKAVTTNVTAFFREAHHFENLADALLELSEKFPSMHIWCAASSTGEEPWSIAMTVQEFLQKKPSAKIRITATDIDEDVLHKAENGEYIISPEIVENHPLLKKYLLQKPDSIPTFTGEHHYAISPKLKSLVTFQKQNLLHTISLPSPKAHVVFCRNVIIYFSKDTQRELFQRIGAIMPAESRLYLGHSENLLNVSDAYTSLGKTVFQRKS